MMALLLLAQEIEVVVRDVWRDEPRIVCEGTADLPEGSRLELKIYYGAYEPGRDLQYRSALVRGGAFAQEFFIFPGTNLPGRYTLRTTFPSGASRNFPFRIGAPVDGERGRAKVLEGLARDIRAIVALADDASPDRFQKAWSLAEKAARSPECKALRLEDVAGEGMTDLCRRLKSVAAARSAFDRKAQRLLDRLASEQIGGDALGGLAEELRGTLGAVSGRKDFTAALLRLQVKAPARHHAALVELASTAVTLFDESCPKEEKERKLRQEVEPLILRLIEEFKRSRWE